ncbi:MAG: hypothetical protein FWE95_00655 [Planctomycetaceae bacterium]|nr:hypothetical protein [Planctomycetaceae bacterium]
MKHLLPCTCGESVEIEPGQAGQTVKCRCGENLLVPTMLQIKALPVAPDKPVSPKEKTKAQNKAVFAMLVPGVVCLLLSFPLWYFVSDLIAAGFIILGCAFLAASGAPLAMLIPGIVYLLIAFVIWLSQDFFHNYGPLLLGVCVGLGCVLLVATFAVVLRKRFRSDDTNILSQSFFYLGVFLLFPTSLFSGYMYAWTPDPLHALFKRTQYTFGSNQRMLPQDSTPIPWEERMILWMTDERIDQMTPIEFHQFYLTLEEPTFSINFRENYDAVWKTYRIWITVNVIMYILALASIGVSFVMPKQNVVVTGWSGSEW